MSGKKRLLPALLLALVTLLLPLATGCGQKEVAAAQATIYYFYSPT